MGGNNPFSMLLEGWNAHLQYLKAQAADARSNMLQDPGVASALYSGDPTMYRLTGMPFEGGGGGVTPEQRQAAMDRLNFAGAPTGFDAQGNPIRQGFVPSTLNINRPLPATYPTQVMTPALAKSYQEQASARALTLNPFAFGGSLPGGIPVSGWQWNPKTGWSLTGQTEHVPQVPEAPASPPSGAPAPRGLKRSTTTRRLGSGGGVTMADNPGGIMDGPFARSQPGYLGPGRTTSAGTLAQFDTPEHGLDAARALLEQPQYASGNVGQGLQLRSNHAYGGEVAENAGIDATRPMASLSPSEKDALTGAIALREGYRGPLGRYGAAPSRSLAGTQPQPPRVVGQPPAAPPAGPPAPAGDAGVAAAAPPPAAPPPAAAAAPAPNLDAARQHLLQNRPPGIANAPGAEGQTGYPSAAPEPVSTPGLGPTVVAAATPAPERGGVRTIAAQPGGAGGGPPPAAGGDLPSTGGTVETPARDPNALYNGIMNAAQTYSWFRAELEQRYSQQAGHHVDVNQIDPAALLHDSRAIQIGQARLDEMELDKKTAETQMTADVKQATERQFAKNAITLLENAYLTPYGTDPKTGHPITAIDVSTQSGLWSHIGDLVHDIPGLNQIGPHGYIPPGGLEYLSKNDPGPAGAAATSLLRSADDIVIRVARAYGASGRINVKTMDLLHQVLPNADATKIENIHRLGILLASLKRVADGDKEGGRVMIGLRPYEEDTGPTVTQPGQTLGGGQ